MDKMQFQVALDYSKKATERGAVCCSVLQCVAVCCSVLQCVAVCCSVSQCVAVCRSVLQCVAVCRSVLYSLNSMTTELTVGKNIRRAQCSAQRENFSKLSLLRILRYEMPVELTFEKFLPSSVLRTTREFLKNRLDTHFTV